MEKICTECSQKVEENFNFCPHCGLALSEMAKKLDQQKTINAQLVLIASLMNETSDVKTLNLLKEWATKLARK